MSGSKPTQAVWALGLVLLAVLAACGSGSPSAPPMPQPSATPTPAPTPTPTPTPQQVAETARYRVRFQADWSASSHPQDFPSNPHFSGLIGATHAEGLWLWREGELASRGIEAMAEMGLKSPLDSEINSAITQGRAQHLLSGGVIGRSPGSVSMDFEIGRDHPLVTLVSMIAPSPDWFVGVVGLPLLGDQDWEQRVVVELYPWDAGTDDGTSYASADLEALPQRPISRLQQAPVLVDGQVPSFGRFIFERQ